VMRYKKGRPRVARRHIICRIEDAAGYGVQDLTEREQQCNREPVLTQASACWGQNTLTGGNACRFYWHPAHGACPPEKM
jgi:hypothetical protein